MSETTSKKRKASLPLIIAGGVSSLVLALGMSPTFSAFTASITNTVDTAGSGTLVMTETDTSGAIVCNSADAATLASNVASCANINKYGGNLALAPGQSSTTTINIKNSGTVSAASFTLAGSTCTPSANGNTVAIPVDFCSKINIAIVSGVKPIWSGTAAGFATANVSILPLLGVSSLAGGGTTAVSTPFTFTVTLDNSVTNAYQGYKISQPMTWSFSS